MPQQHIKQIDADLKAHERYISEQRSRAVDRFKLGVGADQLAIDKARIRGLLRSQHRQLKNIDEQLSARRAKNHKKVLRYLTAGGVKPTHSVITLFLALEKKLFSSIKREIEHVNELNEQSVRSLACWCAFLERIENECMDAKGELLAPFPANYLTVAVEMLLVSHFFLITLLNREEWRPDLPNDLVRLASSSAMRIRAMYSNELHKELLIPWAPAGLHWLRPRRFEVALSFPDERRRFVSAVAVGLASRLTRERVLYDKFHKAEFNQPKLGVYLPNLYRTDSELIVVFLCDEYTKATWCQLEWGSIDQLIKDAEQYRVMFITFENIGAQPELGISDSDGYEFIGRQQPHAIVHHIMERVKMNRKLRASSR